MNIADFKIVNDDLEESKKEIEEIWEKMIKHIN
jgi:hypothetical protein